MDVSEKWSLGLFEGRISDAEMICMICKSVLFLRHNSRMVISVSDRIIATYLVALTE